MNVYMIREDGQDQLWKAESMQEALTLAEEAYVKAERETETEGVPPGNEKEWREFWHASIVESCTLIGELANP